MINVAAITWTLGILVLVGIFAVVGWGILSEKAARGGEDADRNLLLDLAIQSPGATLVMARYDNLFPPGMVKTRT